MIEAGSCLQYDLKLSHSYVARVDGQADDSVAMLLPEFCAFVEFNIGEGDVRKATKALSEMPRWRLVVSECYLFETKLRVVDESEVLAYF